MNEKTLSLLSELKASFDSEFLSPNVIADYAFNKGISLSSEEIVWISDNA